MTAIAEQDWQQVAARKERIAAQCELNATLAAERMTDKLQGTDNIPLNTLVPAFGVSVDKLAILRGHVPSVNIANIWMPSESSAPSAVRSTTSWMQSRRALTLRLQRISRKPQPGARQFSQPYFYFSSSG